ncbi:MAG: site-specific integrase [Chlamydiota bacterium]
MKALIDTFLDEMLAQGRSVNTVRTYRSGLLRFAREIGKPIAEIASRDVHVWLMGLKGISPARRHNIRCSLATFFDWCRRWDHIPEERDIMFRVGKIKRQETVKRWLTQAQVRKIQMVGCQKALRGFLRFKTQAVIRFMALTSWRLNEALSLRWTDIEFERAYMSYKLKGGSSDTYPLDGDIIALLRDYRKQYDRWQKRALRRKLKSVQECARHGYVFPARTGKKWLHAYDAVRAAGAAIGIKVHPHMLRRSFAQWYMDTGGQVDGLQMLMGHRDPRTTQGYYIRDLKLKRRARKGLKFRL